MAGPLGELPGLDTLDNDEPPSLAEAGDLQLRDRAAHGGLPAAARRWVRALTELLLQLLLGLLRRD